MDQPFTYTHVYLRLFSLALILLTYYIPSFLSFRCGKHTETCSAVSDTLCHLVFLSNYLTVYVCVCARFSCL